jgi:hypothetical protein
MWYLNLFDQIGLIIFLIFDIQQFSHWARKLKKLHDYEKQIYHEFEE